jgi:hypothetical protein
MRDGKRVKRGRKKGQVISKVPQIEFNLEAIKEIKKRRKRSKERKVS